MRKITGSIDKNQYFSYEPQARKEACGRFTLDEVYEKLLSFLTGLEQNELKASTENVKDLHWQTEQSLKENEIRFAIGNVCKTIFIKNVEIINRKFVQLGRK